MRNFKDHHHILHDRQEWSLRPEAQYLREQPMLIPRIWHSTHNEIHRECPAVPLLGVYALRRIASEYEPADTHMKAMDNLLFAMDSARYHPKAKPIERELVNLAMMAVDLQRPYIQQDVSERVFA